MIFGIDYAAIWIIACFVLIMIEMMVGTGYLLNLAAAAGVAGIGQHYAPSDVGMQFLVFSVANIVFYMLWQLTKKKCTPSGPDYLSHPEKQLIGRHFTLIRDISGGLSGQIQVGDQIWDVEGPDLKAGATVKVVDADKLRITVESAD